MVKKKVEDATPKATTKHLETIENWSIFGTHLVVVDVHTHSDGEDGKIYQPVMSVILDDFSGEEDLAENRKFITITLDSIFKTPEEAIYHSVKGLVAVFENISNHSTVFDENFDTSKEYNVDKVIAKMEKAEKKKSKSGVSFY